MTQYDVTGMSCAACSARVEKAVNGVDGVEECAVSLLTNSMAVKGNARPEDVIHAVEKAGYQASLKETASAPKAKSDTGLLTNTTEEIKRRLIVSCLFLAVLMYVSMGHVMLSWPMPAFFEGNSIALALLEMILCTAVMIINQRFFISGVKAVLSGGSNMDTLVALGSSAAFAYSTVMLFRMTAADENEAAHILHNLYFESAAMILTLITVGKMLESGAKEKTTDALKGLMSIVPEKATVVIDGEERQIEAKDVQKGQTFIVRPGEKIPADGTVTEGESTVDESALSGESVPVDKQKGDRVLASSININGCITCTAQRVGEDTTISSIIRIVSDAAATKAPIARTADRVSGVFVPAVITIALITTVIWIAVSGDIGFALGRGISVLVISCPCALGLATPVAIMVGSGIGAKHGILFKSAQALENAGKTDTVVLDKTGTITTGVPAVTDVIPSEGISENELLKVAYSIENLSEHPLAKAVAEYASDKNIRCEKCEKFTALPGSGVEGILNGKKTTAGSFKFISSKTDIDKKTSQIIGSLSDEGKTPLVFTQDGKITGIIAVADTVKPDSAKAVSQLEKMGITSIMLTGDNIRTAKAIAKQSGIDTVQADVLPDEKAAAVIRQKADGIVTMVGDGINDAPALAAADIGVAIGSGTDIAADASDVVLMNSSLIDLAAAVRLSRYTLRIIYENLFWAFIYNIIGIPVAAGVLSGIGITLSPMIGAAAMSLSSFCVVSNALRLNTKDIYDDSKDKPKKKKETKNKQMERTISVEGMMCPHCEARVRKALEGISGVEVIEVSHEKNHAIVKAVNVSDETLKTAIEAQDYKVTEIR